MVIINKLLVLLLYLGLMSIQHSYLLPVLKSSSLSSRIFGSVWSGVFKHRKVALYVTYFSPIYYYKAMLYK